MPVHGRNVGRRDLDFVVIAGEFYVMLVLPLAGDDLTIALGLLRPCLASVKP
jgi:hypothetical protein